MNKQQKQELIELVEKYNKRSRFEISEDDFINNAKRYIRAIKQNRMICSIDTVSASGMSRTMKFLEMAGKGDNHYLYNFYLLFNVLGYTKVKNTDYFRISGCGMDMVFATNYEIIHQLAGLGLMTKPTRDKLAQCTPHVI